jgi:hypothetical protein
MSVLIMVSYSVYTCMYMSHDDVNREAKASSKVHAVNIYFIK